jgi:hypothetical protein
LTGLNLRERENPPIIPTFYIGIKALQSVKLYHMLQCREQ